MDSIYVDLLLKKLDSNDQFDNSEIKRRPLQKFKIQIDVGEQINKVGLFLMDLLENKSKKDVFRVKCLMLIALFKLSVDFYVEKRATFQMNLRMPKINYFVKKNYSYVVYPIGQYLIENY